MPRLIRKALSDAGVDADESYGGVDVIGDIAIVRVPELSAGERRRVARALLKEARNVKCVFEQVGGVEGELRTKTLKHIGGDDRTMTVHRESGCAFRVDVATCYFSPRLSTERLRLAALTREGERVLNMFAGVGPFSIVIAKKTGARVTSVDVNSVACDLHRMNVESNRVGSLVRVVNADAGRLGSKVRGEFDRVLMPHPSRADKYLPAAMRFVKDGGTIHYYRHAPGEDSLEAERWVVGELAGIIGGGSSIATRRVREVGPRWVEVVADIVVRA